MITVDYQVRAGTFRGGGVGISFGDLRGGGGGVK